MSMIDIKKPQDVSTATTVTLGLIGGWVTARETGIRPLGGVILGAAGVAAAGVLGFAGLIVPHAARLVVGANLRWQIPVAALGGAVLVTACDTLGRWAFAPTEIPVGALIALIGAPYFIFLLTRLTRVRNGG